MAFKPAENIDEVVASLDEVSSRLVGLGESGKPSDFPLDATTWDLRLRKYGLALKSKVVEVLRENLESTDVERLATGALDAITASTELVHSLVPGGDVNVRYTNFQLAAGGVWGFWKGQGSGVLLGGTGDANLLTAANTILGYSEQVAKVGELFQDQLFGLEPVDIHGLLGNVVYASEARPAALTDSGITLGGL